MSFDEFCEPHLATFYEDAAICGPLYAGNTRRVPNNPHYTSSFLLLIVKKENELKISFDLYDLQDFSQPQPPQTIIPEPLPTEPIPKRTLTLTDCNIEGHFDLSNMDEVRLEKTTLEIYEGDDLEAMLAKENTVMSGVTIKYVDDGEDEDPEDDPVSEIEKSDNPDDEYAVPGRYDDESCGHSLGDVWEKHPLSYWICVDAAVGEARWLRPVNILNLTTEMKAEFCVAATEMPDPDSPNNEKRALELMEGRPIDIIREAVKLYGQKAMEKPDTRPSQLDDADKGYKVGDFWDKHPYAQYLCTDNTSGRAIWSAIYDEEGNPVPPPPSIPASWQMKNPVGLPGGLHINTNLPPETSDLPGGAAIKHQTTEKPAFSYQNQGVTVNFSQEELEELAQQRVNAEVDLNRIRRFGNPSHKEGKRFLRFLKSPVFWVAFIFVTLISLGIGVQIRHEPLIKDVKVQIQAGKTVQAGPTSRPTSKPVKR